MGPLPSSRAGPRRLRPRFTQSERSIFGGLSRLGIAGGGFQYLIRRAGEDADTKDYERADHRPPGERDFWNRSRLLERPGDPEQGCHRVQEENVQLADDHSHEKPGGNSDHVSKVGPSPFGEHTDEEHSEHGAQNESGDSEYDWDDSQI